MRPHRSRKGEFDAEYRIVLQDGTIKHLHTIGHPVLNESGDVVEYVGTGMDVTEQRQAQAALETAFEEIKRLKDRLQDENLALREEIDQAFMFEEIVGASPALKSVLSHVSKVAPTDSTVLISGETGTGKELIARAIHKHSRRADRAFISLNCAATPPSLIASELFGHEKGAFTGAVQQRRGRFELAHNGTIFLDEIGEIPMDTQVALLRVLQERQLERVGGSRPIPVDVRVVAATNRDLSVAIAEGSFRSDLFYRLNVFPDPRAAAAQTPRRHSDPGRVLRQAICGKDGQADSPDRQANAGGSANGTRGRATFVSSKTSSSARSSCARVTPSRSTRHGCRLRCPLARTGPRSQQTLQDQEKEMIEAALLKSRGKVAGPRGAAAETRHSRLDAGIEDQAAWHREAPVHDGVLTHWARRTGGFRQRQPTRFIEPNQLRTSSSAARLTGKVLRYQPLSWYD